MICARCNDENWAYRRKTNRAGKYQYGRQCLTCGGQVGTWIKHSEVREPEAMPAWDDYLAGTWWQTKMSAIQAKRETERAQWFAQHSQYLRSEAWERRRRRVLERSEGLCEGCRERAAAHVHHLSYEHWQRELLYELVALCEPCHQRAHEKGAA